MKRDLTVLVLRFAVGLLLGGILFLFLSLGWGLPLQISVPIPFLVGLLATILGDKFIVAFLKFLSNWPAG